MDWERLPVVPLYADVQAYCSHVNIYIIRGYICCPLIHDSFLPSLWLLVIDLKNWPMLVKLSYVEQKSWFLKSWEREFWRMMKYVGEGALWDTQYQQTELLFVYSHSLGMDDSWGHCAVPQFSRTVNSKVMLKVTILQLSGHDIYV